MTKLMPSLTAGSSLLLAAGIGFLTVPDAPFNSVLMVCAGAFGLGLVIGHALRLISSGQGTGDGA